MPKAEREIRFEYLRPAQLNDEMAKCPLVFLPIGPLEYHGPHLPVGMDPINATQCALESCRRLGKGVVHPTLFWGTERERPEWMLKSLGFKKSQWVIGMDFPTALWRSHYYSEQIFGMVLASTLEMLISRGYKLIVITNGHGAWNHLQTIERLALDFSRNTSALVVWKLAIAIEVHEREMMGHADAFETSLMMYYEKERLGSGPLVDLGTLPKRGKPIRYTDFSIVDGPGFSEKPHPDRVVQEDPRDAEASRGKKIFEETVKMYVDLVNDSLRRKNPR